MDTNDLDEAIRLTKTVTQRWWLNPKVKFHGSKEWGMLSCRSTTIGDVLVKDDGSKFAVDLYGTIPINL